VRRDIGDDNGVPPAGAALEGSQVLARLWDGLVRRPTATRRPGGGPAELGDLGDVLVLLHDAVWSTAACQAAAGAARRLLIGSGDGHPLVNSTARRREASDSSAR
jgi:hypothetical protein